MMNSDLASYLERKGLSQSAFGALSGISAMTVSRAINGRQVSTASIRKMVEASNGEIPFGSFFKCVSSEPAAEPCEARP